MADNKEALFEKYGFSAKKSSEPKESFGELISESPVEAPVPEEVISAIVEEAIEEKEPDVNYMASMKDMFVSLKSETPEEEEIAPAEVPTETNIEIPEAPAEEDEPERKPFREAPATEEVPSEEEKGADLGGETVRKKIKKSAFGAINMPDESVLDSDEVFEDIKAEMMAEPQPAKAEADQLNFHEIQKDDDYWSFIDSLLDNFDDGKVHTDFKPKYTAVEKKEVRDKRAAQTASYMPPVPGQSGSNFNTAAPEKKPEVKASAQPTAAAEPAEASRQSSYFMSGNTKPQPPVMSTVKPDEVAEVETPRMQYFGAAQQKAPEPEQTPEPYVPEPPVFRPAEEGAEAEPSKRELKAQAKAEKKQAKEDAKAQKAAEKQAQKQAKEDAKAQKAAEKQAKKESKKNRKTEAEEPVKVEEHKEEPKEETAEPKKSSPIAAIIKVIAIILAVIVLATAVLFGYSKFSASQNMKLQTSLAQTFETGSRLDGWDDAYDKYPDVKFPSDMQVDFAPLYAENRDVVGWISIPGLNIEYPVTQADDNSYYANHNFNGNFSVYGNPFLDKDNDAKDLDLNNVIYGQSMKQGGQMFTTLAVYKTVTGFIENPVIEYDTLTENYKFKVYGVFITNSTEEADNGYVFDYAFQNLGSLDSFASYIEEINTRRIYNTGVDIESSDKLLTLSTASDEFKGARLVVVARLVRDEESEGIDTSRVSDNKTPRYPQAYYDALGVSNPYKNATKWVPTVS